MPWSYILSLSTILIAVLSVANAADAPKNAAGSSWRSTLSKLGGGSLQPHPKHKIKKRPLDESLSDEEEDDVHVTAQFIAETNLPTDLGYFRLRAYRTPQSQNQYVGAEPCVIYSADKPPFGADGRLLEGVPVRVHDQCFTSEVFRSQRCDCKEQLKMALSYIQQHGGCIVYMQQEGRGIGLANKVAAYALQDEGLDTVDANVYLGLPEDCRQYGCVPSILRDLGISSIRLITNNPRKVQRLSSLGVKVDGTIPMVVPKATPYNRRYLETKQERMAHENFGEMLARSPQSLSSSPNDETQ